MLASAEDADGSLACGRVEFNAVHENLCGCSQPTPSFMTKNTVCRVRRGWREGGRTRDGWSAGIPAGWGPSAGSAVPSEPGGEHTNPLPRQPLRQLHVPLF